MRTSSFMNGCVKRLALGRVLKLPSTPLTGRLSALLVTRNIFGWLLHFNLMKRISMLHLISSKHFDFLGKWKLSVICSLILLITSGVAFALRGPSMFNLDFTGGD